jgi:hypothetical protein
MGRPLDLSLTARDFKATTHTSADYGAPPSEAEVVNCADGFACVL